MLTAQWTNLHRQICYRTQFPVQVVPTWLLASGIHSYAAADSRYPTNLPPYQHRGQFRVVSVGLAHDEIGLIHWSFEDTTWSVLQAKKVRPRGSTSLTITVLVPCIQSEQPAGAGTMIARQEEVIGPAASDGGNHAGSQVRKRELF